MKFFIAFAAILAVSSAQFLTRDFGAVVEGSKAVIAGPSGTITADTGAIVKSAGLVTPTVLAPRLISPIAAPLITPVGHRLIGSPLVASRFIGSPLIDSHLYGAPLHRGLYGHGFLGDRSLYGNYFL